MVSGAQYITVNGQQTVTIPVVGSMQGHIGHVVQVSQATPGPVVAKQSSTGVFWSVSHINIEHRLNVIQ